MAFASGGPGTQRIGAAPGAQSAASGAFQQAGSEGFQGLLSTAQQALAPFLQPQQHVGGWGSYGGGAQTPMMGGILGQLLGPYMR